MSRVRRSASGSYRSEEHHPLLVGTILLAALAAIAGAGWWVWRYSRAQAFQMPLAVGAGFDVSQSVTIRQKQQAVSFLNKLIGTVMPPRTPTKIWRFAEGVETVHESRPIASKDLWQVSRDTIEKYMGKWGTRPDKVLHEFQQYMQQFPERRFVLCLFTDGECHAAEATRERAAQLAQNEQVAALVVGPVTNQYRAKVENEYYAPLRDAGKLFVFGETDALDTLQRVKEQLRAIDRSTAR
ncbi:MAG: VWA domain-containing protein [Armatimonadota bacterium]|nr:VWA domain-containing protein [Armatimonadota bacterium]MDW8104147.1 VWA domain-containing protein [Armatimonadota bacterium]MDW8291037.1 VWA domain-containing protein [Armatimonadota bacterium]